MIEEYNENAENLTDDEDIATKLNSVINQVQNEIARFKKIDAYKQMEVTAGQTINLTDIDINIYQLNIIKGVSYDPIANRIIFNETGTADIYYYKYPTQINTETEDTYKFELDSLYPRFVGKATVPGNIINQFAMDEYDGNFRIATTKSTNYC